MKSLFSILLLTVFLAAPVLAQSNWLNEVSAPAIPVIPEGKSQFAGPVFNATLAETLDGVFDTVTSMTPIKGFTAAMLLPDGSVWKRAKGVAAEVPTAVPLTTDHLLGMGSITKSFVAVTLLLLHDDGLLDLGDSIGKFLPTFPNVPGGVTIRQLLGHRSGISDYFNENPAMLDALFLDLNKVWVPDSILNGFVLAPNFPVGESWSYSNTNYLLAGMIIESITGQPWHTVVRQRLLEPQGLTHTFAHPYELPGGQPFSHLFADIDGDGAVDDWQGLGLSDAGLFSLANSGGNLISTPEDLVRFSERVYGGHVLKPATLAEMQTDYVLVPGSGEYGLGASQFLLPQNLENWGHNGDLIYQAFALYFPTEKMSLAVQQNDEREFDSAAADPVLDLYVLYVALLDAYLNYSPPSATVEMGRQTGFAVFPNPADAFFRVTFSEGSGQTFPLQLLLTDVNGKVVLSEMIENGGDEIQVGQLPPGVYGLRAGRFSGKIVRQ